MSKKDEALKLALEALEWHTNGKAYIPLKSQSAITAIREALTEQPAQQQEPVAIADGTFNHNCPVGTPLYTSPPPCKPWVGLTEEELQKILQEVSGKGWKPMLEAIEAKLKEKNA